MVDIVKLDMAQIWATGGDVIAPDAAKITAGWSVEVVPRQWWNWMQNRADTNIAYLLQKGIVEWDATTEYLANKSFVNVGGIIYKSTVTGTNRPPATNPTYWVRAFADYSASLNALRALTPAANAIPYFTSTTAASTFLSTAYSRTMMGIGDAAAMRTHLNAQQAHGNLTALSGVSAATNMLPYFTSGTAMGTTNLSSFGRTLIDDADAASARTTLGLGNAAVATTTESQTDGTLGRLLRVGDFGVGTSVAPQVTAADSVVSSGSYYVQSTATGIPIAANGTLEHVAWNGTSAALQRYSTLSTPVRHFIRTKSSSAWTAWEEVVTVTKMDAKFTSYGLTNQNMAGLPDIDDFNVGNGWYAIDALTAGTKPAGMTYGVIMVSGRNWSVGRVMQTYYGTEVSGNPRMWIRLNYAKTWSAWKEISSTTAQTLVDATLTGKTSVIVEQSLTSDTAMYIKRAATTYVDQTGASLVVANDGNNDATSNRMAGGVTIANFQPTLNFIDLSASAGSGRWHFDTVSTGNAYMNLGYSADGGATWQPAKYSISSRTGNVGMSGSSPYIGVALSIGDQAVGSSGLTGSTLVGARSYYNAGPDATVGVYGFITNMTVGNGTTTATTADVVDFQSNTNTVNAGHTVTTMSGFSALDKTSTQIQTARAFNGAMNTRGGVSRYNLYMQGTAPNWMRGATTIGGGDPNIATTGNVALYVNGHQTINGNLSVGALAATTVTTTNLTVSGAFSPTSVNTPGAITSGTNLNVGADLSVKGVAAIKGGLVAVYSTDPASNAHLWFYDNAGNTRGILYAQQDATMTLQAGGGVVASFYPASSGRGGIGVNGAVTAGAVTTTGSITMEALSAGNGSQIVSRKSGVPTSLEMYAYVGYQSQTTDGTPPGYAFHKVGNYAATLYLDSLNQLAVMGSDGSNVALTNTGNIGPHVATIYTGNIGSTCMLYNTGGGVAAGGTADGSQLRYGSHNSNNGGTPAGTWRAMGNGNSGGSSVWLRVA